MMKQKLFFVLICVFASPFLVFSLEVKAGNTKIDLYEDLGRFNISSMINEEEESFYYFLDSKDRRTSLVSIKIDNTIHILGESPGFEGQAEETGFGARYVWYSRDVLVIEEFTIISASEVMFSLFIANVSGRDLKIGAVYLFDTYLGESSPSHFQTDLGTGVVSETVHTKQNPVAYWSTTTASENNPEFIVFTQGKGITDPDRIVFGNLFRLKKDLWKTPVKTGTLLLDSAVGQYYDPVLVKANEERKIVFALRSEGFALASDIPPDTDGALADSGKNKTSTDTSGNTGVNPADSTKNPTVTGKEKDIGYENMRLKMSLLNSLVEELNRRLEDGAQYSSEERARLWKLLERLSTMSPKEYLELADQMDQVNAILISINEKLKRGAIVSESDIEVLDALLQK
ncbi:MAG: hypothetical protein JW904_02650 [Spirochaetales bacterium]|nr:hypothetical protein [Spirochaetales bacterium]